MSEPRPTYIPPAYLAFTPEQREACQRWHDATDEFFEDHQTVDQRAEMFRRTEAALKESRAIAAATLRNSLPCARCGARAGEPYKSIAHEVGK